MGEQDEVATVRSMYEAFLRGDVAGVLEHVTDVVRWFSHVDPVVPTSGDWSGKANVPGFFAAIGANIEVTSFATADFWADGDAVVSTGRFGGTVRATGASIDSAWVFLYRFRDGLVSSYEQFHDGALAAAFR